MRNLEKQLGEYCTLLASIVRDDAKDRCNVDTGLLKSSIKVIDGENDLQNSGDHAFWNKLLSCGIGANSGCYGHRPGW